MVSNANTFVEGNVLNFSVAFTTEATGNPIDPTNVAFGYRINGGSITILKYGVSDAVTNPSVGNYVAEVDTTGFPGTWVWEWQSTGTGQALISGSITVTQSAMTLLS